MDGKGPRSTVALTYDDVQLVPQFSRIKSRLDVDISTRFYTRKASVPALQLDIPIISAAMDTVTNGEMAAALCDVGAFGIVHRYQTVAQRLEQLGMAKAAGVSIGLDDSLDSCLKLAEVARILNVDVAHADTQRVVDFVEVLRRQTDRLIMVGNIATKYAVRKLVAAGADILKVGIGGGSICSTRMVTGFGVPNITAIMEVRQEVDNLMQYWEHEKYESDGGRITIVADGGIRYPCDIAKALAAGADAVMLGSMIAGTNETPGKLTMCPDGHFGKVYRGMASKDAQVDWRGMKEGTAAEGVSTYVRQKGSVVPILKDLAGGLRSAFTYAGANNLNEFYESTEFVRVTQAGVTEASPHILTR